MRSGVVHMVAYVTTFPTSRPVKGDLCHLLHSSFLAPSVCEIDQEQVVDVSADVVVVAAVVVVAVASLSLPFLSVDIYVGELQR